jgi:hypothetical protein
MRFCEQRGHTIEPRKAHLPAEAVLAAVGDDQPSMSVPLFWNEAGLPIGSMFSARCGDEATLYRLAAQLEQAAAAERETRRKEAAATLAAKQKERSKAAAAWSRAAAARSKLAGGGKRGRGKIAAAGPASESVRAAARGKLARDTRAGARKGHQSAAGKRNQARRDRRS